MKEKNMKNFIIFWLSQSFSQLGSAMTSFALVIWAYKQTDSALTVSLMTFCSYVPYIVVSVFAGTLIDNHKKKSIMLLSDCVAAICSIIVLLLVSAGSLEIWHIYIVNGLIGFMNAFQSPAQSVAIGIMVPEDQYARASGMDSFSSNLLTVVTPMLAAAITSFWGLKGVILIDVVTFASAFIVLMFFVHIEEIIKQRAKKLSVFNGFSEGLKFLKANKGILYIIISMAVLNFFSRLTYENILSPMLLARSGGSNAVLGTVSSVLGIGGIVGGFIVATGKFTKNYIKMIYFSAAFSFLLGDLLMGLGRNVFVWSFAGLAASAPIPFIFAGLRTILYKTVPQEIQGRIFSVRNAIQYSTIPFGILLGGFLADYVFEPFMNSENIVVSFLQYFIGEGKGSGMAVMFLCTGILGCLASMIGYRLKEIQKLMDIR